MVFNHFSLLLAQFLSLESPPKSLAFPGNLTTLYIYTVYIQRWYYPIPQDYLPFENWATDVISPSWGDIQRGNWRCKDLVFSKSPQWIDQWECRVSLPLLSQETQTFTSLISSLNIASGAESEKSFVDIEIHRCDGDISGENLHKTHPQGKEDLSLFADDIAAYCTIWKSLTYLKGL